MIVDKLLRHPRVSSKIPKRFRGAIKALQKVTVICDVCGKKKKRKRIYREVLILRATYKKDLCCGCLLKVQYAKGLRKSKGWDFLNKRGNTYVKRFGAKRAKEIKEKIGVHSRGKNNPMYGKNYQCYGAVKRTRLFVKGKKFEEIYGKKKAKEMRDRLSNASRGKNNPMYGKPTPVGCGKGWKGWYKGYFFRSCLELSFIVNFLEPNNIPYKTAERDPFRIPYLDENKRRRTYTADFVVKKYLIEVKPYEHLNKPINVIKRNAAIRWCRKNGYNYKTYTEKDFESLTHEDMFKLYKNGFLKFLKPYKKFLLKITGKL
jgi:hypothetical protein